MDVSAFSDENFEVKEWINKTFQLPEAQENRDTFTSSLVMKLQLFIQKVHSSLEESSQQVLQSLPRVVREVESLQQEASLLQERMGSVRDEIGKVERDTAQSMETLVKMDTVKGRIQATSQALREADNWTTLAADVEEVFESGDLEAISARLVSMQHSLQILAHVPDFEERRLQLEGHKNRLEALASPQIVVAFTSKDAEKSRTYCKIFLDMDRLPELLKYYHKCERTSLVNRWRQLVESEDDAKAGVLDWSARFYDHVLSNWHDQARWCGAVFGSAATASLLVALHTDVLSSLDPTMEFCIEAGLKQQAQEDHLQFLCDLKDNSARFYKAAESSFLEEGTPEKMEFTKATYSPYVLYVCRYGTIEEACLLSNAAKLVKSDLGESIRELARSVTRLPGVIADSVARCWRFTDGSGAEGLHHALKSYLGSYIDKYKIVLRQLERQRREEDWVLFQQCLSFMQCSGEMAAQIEAVDRIIVAKLDSIDMTEVLLRPEKVTSLQKFIARVRNEESFLGEVSEWASKTCGDITRTSIEVVFAPVSTQLDLLAARVGDTSRVLADLPSFSFSPQEYITQVGQYLMMLPQHLEPFVLSDNPGLSRSFEEACRSGQVLGVEFGAGVGSGVSPGEVLLGGIAKATCQAYAEQLMRIRELNAGDAKQFSTDIDYLGNILDDLGFSLSDNLQNLNGLLKIPPDDYGTATRGFPPRLVAAVRQMRNITPKL